MLVDLPGYGYAKVPASVRKTWRPMIEAYLTRREALKGIVLLVDIRRIFDERERLFVAWLGQHNQAVIPVLTKSDKLSKRAQNRQWRLTMDAMATDSLAPILFSAKTRQGREAVWEAIKKLTPQEGF